MTNKKKIENESVQKKDISRELDMSLFLELFSSEQAKTCKPAGTNRKLDTERGLIGVDKPSR